MVSDTCQVCESLQHVSFHLTSNIVKINLSSSVKGKIMNSFNRYAEYYDLLYTDKDYLKECDFIEDIFDKFSAKPIKSVLDCGCGTGGHSLPLAQRGYAVTGIDVSEREIKHARQKARERKLRIDFRQGDLRQLELGKTLDACICMFAVLNYIIATEDIIQTLRRIRNHIATDSIFTFDIWNGIAVIRELPSVRVKEVQNDNIRVIRTAEPELDTLNHLCRVNYHLIVTQGNSLVEDVRETHTIRYLFPQEIAHYLKDAGFEVMKICPFLDLSGKVDESTWNIAFVAKAV